MSLIIYSPDLGFMFRVVLPLQTGATLNTPPKFKVYTIKVVIVGAKSLEASLHNNT